ncbi:MAG TPA: hypothetical protein VI953_01345 [Candidatus Paceibacterota bacterium]
MGPKFRLKPSQDLKPHLANTVRMVVGVWYDPGSTWEDRAINFLCEMFAYVDKEYLAEELVLTCEEESSIFHIYCERLVEKAFAINTSLEYSNLLELAADGQLALLRIRVDSNQWKVAMGRLCELHDLFVYRGWWAVARLANLPQELDEHNESLIYLFKFRAKSRNPR